MKTNQIIKYIFLPVMIIGFSIAGWYAIAQEVTGEDDGDKEKNVKVKVKVTEDVKTKAFLGVHTGSTADGSGVVVEHVVEGSAAEGAGLKDGDIITAVGDKKIASTEELVDAIRSREPGEEVEVAYTRDGKVTTSKVKLGERKQEFHMYMAPHVEKIGKCIKDVDWDKFGKELEEHIEQYDWKSLEKKLEKEMSKEDWEKFGKEMEEHFRDMGNSFQYHFRSGEEDMRISIRVEDVTDEDEVQLKDKADVTAGNTLKLKSVKFAPNPGNGRFDLEFNLPDKGTTTIRVFDSNGRRVYDETLYDFKGAYSQSIDISGEPNGVYFITIEQNGKGLSKKVVKQ